MAIARLPGLSMFRFGRGYVGRLALIGAGIFVASFELFRMVDFASWRNTPGVVTNVNIELDDEGEPTYRATYEYTVSGTTYSDEQPIAPYQHAVGDPVTVHYDPANPSDSLLYPRGSFVLCCAFGAVAVGAALMLADARGCGAGSGTEVGCEHRVPAPRRTPGRSVDFRLPVRSRNLAQHRLLSENGFVLPSVVS